VVGGAHYEIEAHFPPLPAGTPRVSLSTPGTQGVFTGIRVENSFDELWDGSQAPKGEAPSHWDVEPGQTITMPVNDGDVPEEGEDLYSIVETTEVVKETSSTEHRVDPDADVLFDFDESVLTDEATATLDEVIEETREKADPELPPITVVGHTDGKGSDEHNQPLSENRAGAVREYLEEGLGTDYEYESQGRGSEEPVAAEGGDDDEEARARNRRVEISHNILSVEEIFESSEEETVSALVGTGNIAPPAPYADQAEEPIASVEGHLEQAQSFDFTLDVYSPRRDGAFAAVEVDLTNNSGSTPPSTPLSGSRGRRAACSASSGSRTPAAGTCTARCGSARPTARTPSTWSRSGTPT
jgi:outer membrane protein OmpA-like peptidoglycan-associated protein